MASKFVRNNTVSNDPKVRFLIVDDHQSIRKLCMTVGASLGFDCREAESAEAALAFLETDAPDIVLADLMMPNMSGLGISSSREADAAAQ